MLDSEMKSGAQVGVGVSLESESEREDQGPDKESNSRPPDFWPGVLTIAPLGALGSGALHVHLHYL